MIVVAKLKPRGIFDYMSRIFLYAKGTYKHIMTDAEKLDSDRKRNFNVKCFPLVNPKIIIPDYLRESGQNV